MNIRKAPIGKYAFILVLSSFALFSAKTSMAQDADPLVVLFFDFLYPEESIYTPGHVEKQVILPALEGLLPLSANYTIRFAQVDQAIVRYFSRRAIQEQASQVPDYDVAIWGRVIPYNHLGNYNIDILGFVNPEKHDNSCVVHHFLEVREGRIDRWLDSGNWDQSCNKGLPSGKLSLMTTRFCANTGGQPHVEDHYTTLSLDGQLPGAAPTEALETPTSASLASQ